MIHEDCHCPRAEHHHGTDATYNAHKCRCDLCRRATAAARRRQYRLAAIETHNPDRTRFVDAKHVLIHIEKLRRSGMSTERIAELSGLSRGSVGRLIWPSRAGEQPATGLRRATVEKILAVKPDPSPGHVVDPTGARRRLQALVAIGWSSRELARRLGKPDKDGLNRLLRGAQPGVRLDFFEKVGRLYEELWNTHPAGPTATRARNAARAKGWLTPMAWDDERIDDPNYHPQQKPVGFHERNAA